MLLWGRPAAVIRMRGWERYAYVAFGIATSAAGALSVSTLFGASIGKAVTDGADTIAGFTGLAAVIAFVLAMCRYDGELEDVRPVGETTA